MTDIIKELQLTGVEEHEFLDLLDRRYGGSCRSGRREVIFPCQDRLALKVKRGPDGLRAVETGPEFGKAEVVELADAITKELKETEGPRIVADVLFASLPVTGCFAALTNGLQILPAPPEAPRPGYLHAKHPFVLEFAVDRSSNELVNVVRRHQGRYEWTWILNVLLEPMISCQTGRSQHFWALCGDDDKPSTSNIRFVSEGYMVPGFRWTRDSWSGCERPLGVEPHNEYYDVAARDELTIPDSLGSSLDALDRLAGPERKRFLRAANVLRAAEQLWDHQVSSYYVAHVQAIEILSRRKVGRDPCPECGLDRSGGPTARFKSFVKKYSNGLDISSRELSRFYSVRSALTHGEDLFQIDDSPWSHSVMYSPIHLHESEVFSSVHRLVRTVLLNWLLAEGGSSEPERDRGYTPVRNGLSGGEQL